MCDSDDVCPGGDDLADADNDSIPDQCDLTLYQIGRVTAGRQVLLVVTGANPSEMVQFFSSPGGVGSGPCPATFGGQCLDLGAPMTALGSRQADGYGVAAMLTTLPASLTPGMQLTFQSPPAGRATVRSRTGRRSPRAR